MEPITTTEKPRGRPPRPDWRLPSQLADEEPGIAVLIYGSWIHGAGRARIIAADDAFVELEMVDGERRREPLEHVVKYRVTPCEFEIGDFVVLRGVAENVWRGVVLRVVDDLVTVEDSDDGVLDLYADELESPWARPAMRLPPVKRGRMAKDPIVELINARAAEARRPELPRPFGVDRDGFAV